MQKTLENFLNILAKKIIKKYTPIVIGITGSMGKTSTKEAIYAVLHEKYKKIRQSEKNYNNEIGVPLTIIGSTSPGRSFFGWLLVLLKAVKLLVVRDSLYPQVLILEMGADKVGDIGYLVEIAPCNVGVLTHIGPVHLERFRTIEKIVREKRMIISHLTKNDIAVINADQTVVMEQKKYTKASIISFGFSEEADIRAIELETSGNGLDVDGMRFKIQYKGSTVPVFLDKVIGKNSIAAALAASAVGVSYGMNLVEISEGLKKYKSPKGRMNLIDGIKHTLIIDDTYNASPEAMIAALEVLAKFDCQERTKKFAVLGNMLELGNLTEASHKEVGEFVAKNNFDVLITVGEQGLLIAEAAKSAGMSTDHVFTFDYAEEAGRFLQDRMKQGDIILVKGSQGVRMEKIVKEVMAQPTRSRELLVRQEDKWLKS